MFSTVRALSPTVENKKRAIVQLKESIEDVSNITNSIDVINIAINQCLDFAKTQNGLTSE